MIEVVVNDRLGKKVRVKCRFVLLRLLLVLSGHSAPSACSLPPDAPFCAFNFIRVLFCSPLAQKIQLEI